MPNWLQASLSTSPHSVMEGADSDSRYATPRPPPTDNSSNPSGSEKAATTFKRSGETVDSEYLTSNVLVNAHEFYAWVGRAIAHRFFGGTRFQSESELGIVLAR